MNITITPYTITIDSIEYDVGWSLPPCPRDRRSYTPVIATITLPDNPEVRAQYTLAPDHPLYAEARAAALQERADRKACNAVIRQIEADLAAEASAQAKQLAIAPAVTQATADPMPTPTAPLASKPLDFVGQTIKGKYGHVTESMKRESAARMESFIKGISNV